MQPLFFGPPDRRLFGIYHPPAHHAAQNSAVLFCHPLAHEFYNAHRCSGQLAGSLSDAGLAVLRFDYYGTGDSPGDWEDASIARWLDDIGCAADELRARGYARLCLVGLRFGATLAALFSAERGAVDGLVLWEPVVSGDHYLSELADVHRQMVAGTPAADSAERGELLGFEFRDGLREELGRIDLRTNHTSLGRHVLLIESPGLTDASLRPSIEASAARFEFEAAAVPRFWLDCPGQTLLPGQIPQRMASWIATACR